MTRELPWPPPTPSTSYKFSNKLFGASRTFADVAQAITRALQTAGYVERRYYAVPIGGVALVTRLERFGPDGAPGDPRWLTSGAEPSLYRLIRGLFLTDPGHFRVIVFFVTPTPPGRVKRHVPVEEAKAWLEGGFDDVPADAGDRPYNDGKTIAYIYDFVSNGRTFVLDREPPPGEVQLQKAGVLAALTAGERR